MKKSKFFIAFLFVWVQAHAQKIDSIFKSNPILEARIRLDEKSRYYNPARSFELYKKLALEDNPEAMNALGIMYSKGVGTPSNINMAIEWFEKSASLKYGPAFMNLGLLYKDGLDISQDFQKAVHYFEKGTNTPFPSNHYYLGYMKYKGLGCKQSYQDAISLFRKAISFGNISSMYMLGLCFRNGYGIEANIDSAKFWIDKAANKGYKFAKEELEESEPEKTAKSKDWTIEEKGKKNSGKSQISKVKSINAQQNIDGYYVGHIIRYDWSGKYIVAKSQLSLKIYKQNNNSIVGEWIEEGKPSAVISAKFKDSLFTFSNSHYEYAHHYSAKKAEEFEFTSATLQFNSDDGTTYLTGNVQLYSNKLKEPEKPIYISLSRIVNSSKNEKLQANQLEAFSTTFKQTDNSFLVYPNPFNDAFQLDFYLDNSQKVNIHIYSLDGQELYHASQFLDKGKHLLDVTPKLPSGTYLLKLIEGKKSRSSLIVKK